MNNILEHNRAISFLLAFIFIACFYQAHSTDTPLLERTISISIKQQRIEEALKRISEQGGFTFSYNPAIIDVTKIVTYNFSNKTIREILDELFDGNINYRERRQYVILSKQKKTSLSNKSRVVTGYITDRTTGKRIPDVTIYDPASLSSSVTDAYGFFKIKIRKPTPDLILKVNKPNYADTVVAVSNRRRLIKITINNKKEKITTLADSVRVKWKRFSGKIFLKRDVKRMNVRDTIYRRAQISIVPFVGTNHLLSGNVINDYSFNIYGGYSQGVRKFEIGGIFNIVRGDVTGTQMAGAFNGVYGKMKGVQLAGYINANHDLMDGAQLAGLINLNWNSVRRFSGAGLLNITRGESQGVVLAGLGNVTFGEQKGLHVSGLFNFSTKDTGPWQLAGLFNFTARAHTGAQVSGLFNYAKQISGLQFGPINVSDSVIRGVPVGLLSFSVKGYHKIEVSADEIFYTNIAFRTGVRKFYNIFTAGIKPENNETPYWSVGYGMGTAPRLNKWLLLNVDVTANQVSKGNFTQAINMINKLYVGVEFQMMKNIGFTAGVTLNDYLTDTTSANYTKIFTDYNPSIIDEYTYSNNIHQKLWLGGKVGVRFF